MKQCTKCKEQLADLEFSKCSNVKSGLQSWCRSCTAQLAKEKGYDKSPKRIEYKKKYEQTAKRKEYLKRYRKQDSAKTINKNVWYKRNYGITLDQYNDLFFKQFGCCAICEKHQSQFKSALAVDHDHQTQEVRGLLCNNCNRGIGHLQDDARIISNAAAYLNRSKLKIVRNA